MANTLTVDEMKAALTVQYLHSLDAAGLARLAGALQGECTARRIRAAIVPTGEAAAALEDFAREQR